jgi:hypothetical protein
MYRPLLALLSLVARGAICLGCALILCGILNPVLAQEGETEARESIAPEEIETDRDSFTPATSITPHCRTIAEMSYSFVDNRIGYDTNSYPELLLRRGITDRLELRLGWNMEVGSGGADISGIEEPSFEGGFEREATLLYGVKAATSEQQGIVPQSAILVQGYTPTQGPEATTQISVGEVFGWRFAEVWQWDSSFRFGSGNDGDDQFSLWSGSTVLKRDLGERWNVHIEYFNVCSSDKEVELSRHFVSFGPHVLLNPNLEIGVRVGFGLNEQSSKFFSNVGVGWRF